MWKLQHIPRPGAGPMWRVQTVTMLRGGTNVFFRAASSFCLMSLACVGACVSPSNTLNSLPDNLHPDALPPLLVLEGEQRPVSTAADWEQRRRPQLKQLFSEHVYGFTPPPPSMSFQRRVIDEKAFDNLATLEEISIQLGPDAAVQLNLLLAIPNSGTTPPVVLMQNKCGNQSLTSHPGVTVSQSWIDASVCNGPSQNRNYRADRYQLEFLVANGYAVATFHESDIDPDRYELEDGVRADFPVDAPQDMAWGMLAAWAWGLERAVDVLVQIDALDPDRIVVYGHSRRGKAALLAAAHDERIRLAIVNQSGTGGATLSRSTNGESVNYINHRFPWWFNDVFPNYNNRENELPVDQHQLIALIAPRSVLIANATGDTWADPQGAYLAARAAHPAWTLYGSEGFAQSGPSPTNYGAPLAYHIREGGHSVSLEDWQVFVRYANEQLNQPAHE